MVDRVLSAICTVGFMLGAFLVVGPQDHLYWAYIGIAQLFWLKALGRND